MPFSGLLFLSLDRLCRPTLCRLASLLFWVPTLSLGLEASLDWLWKHNIDCWRHRCVILSFLIFRDLLDRAMRCNPARWVLSTLYLFLAIWTHTNDIFVDDDDLTLDVGISFRLGLKSRAKAIPIRDRVWPGRIVFLLVVMWNAAILFALTLCTALVN